MSYESSRPSRFSSVVSQTIYDIPPAMRGVIVCIGLCAVVVVVVASLEGGQDTTVAVDKLLHFGGYATLAVIFIMGLRPALFVPALLLLAVMGVAIEFIQPLNARSFDWGDAIANITGLVIGSTIGFLLRVTVRFFRTRQREAQIRKHRRYVERGGLIVREGASARKLYYIEHGEVEVYKEVNGERHTLGRLASGDVFGLIAAIQNEPQYASVEATRNTHVYTMEMRDLISAAGGESGPIAAVLSAMARHLEDVADQLIASTPADAPVRRDGADGG